jgi:hypothetical protein
MTLTFTPSAHRPGRVDREVARPQSVGERLDLGVGVKVIITPPCIFCIENY